MLRLFMGMFLDDPFNAINSLLKKYKLGSVLNGGNTSPNGDKYSSAEDWRNLSKEFYKAKIGFEYEF